MIVRRRANPVVKTIREPAGFPVSLYIYLENVDEAFKIAVDSGADIRMPVEDMFWGDRMGAVQDPFGYTWNLASHTRDLTPEEIQEGARAAFAKMAEK